MRDRGDPPLLTCFDTASSSLSFPEKGVSRFGGGGKNPRTTVHSFSHGSRDGSMGAHEGKLFHGNPLFAAWLFAFRRKAPG